MNQSIRMFSTIATLLVFSVPMVGGGFYVLLGNPEANPQARSLGAVLTLKLAGCHEPEKAQVSALAIGTVEGRRQSIPLELKRLQDAGTYALTRQWPAGRRWVLQFVANDGVRTASMLVASGPGGIERGTAKMLMSLPSEGDIAALLAAAPKPDLAKR